MAANDLTTLADVREWLGVTNDQHDPMLTRLITAASRLLTTYLNRNIIAAAYTDRFIGEGHRVLVLPQYPILSVVSLSASGVSLSLSADGVSPIGGYYFHDRSIYRVGDVFGKGVIVDVSYTAGFATVPEDVAQACIELVALRYRERDRIGQQSKNIGGEVVSYITKDLTEPIRALVNQYRNVVPV